MVCGNTSGNKFTLKKAIAGSLIGLAVVYLIGMTYYYFIANYYLNSPITVSSVMIYCCLVFIPGDAFCCILSSMVAKRVLPVVKGNIVTNKALS